MSLVVKHLNADSTFLLTFRPAFDFPPSPGSTPGSFSILLDPWLSGASTVYSSKFSIQKHSVPSCVESLQDIPEPDVVIVSQDKPDHCHELTLRQLQPDRMSTIILAEPLAAKRIRSWKYFSPEQVQPFEKWDERNGKCVRRFRIPPFGPTGVAGEVTISFIPAKRDLTGLHSAVGITYRPPRATPQFMSQYGLRRPQSAASSKASTSSISSRMDRSISVIYSPHGVSYPHIKSYASSHLVSEAALPLNVLLHPFDRVENPWYLGGTVSAGSPGGTEIAQNLMAQTWISAHDEDKELGGVIAGKERVLKYTAEEIKSLTRDPRKGTGTDVVTLDVGQELSLP